VRLAGEVSNPRDGAARWCSVLMLGQVRDAAPDIADPALHVGAHGIPRGWAQVIPQGVVLW
jgi:hypothetical protein